MLSHPDYKKDMIITVDSSLEGTGYSLTQIREVKLSNNKTKLLEVPIAFGSKAFSLTERKASASEREFFGLFIAVFALKSYLRFTNIIIRVDCQALLTNNFGFNGKFLKQHRMI